MVKEKLQLFIKNKKSLLLKNDEEVCNECIKYEDFIAFLSSIINKITPFILQCQTFFNNFTVQ
jgi:hypothetical protein